MAHAEEEIAKADAIAAGRAEEIASAGLRSTRKKPGRRATPPLSDDGDSLGLGETFSPRSSKSSLEEFDGNALADDGGFDGFASEAAGRREAAGHVAERVSALDSLASAASNEESY